MHAEEIRQDYDAALGKLAAILCLEFEEVRNFVGDVSDGVWGAGRLKELFKGSDVHEQLDSIVKISETYQSLFGVRTVQGASCLASCSGR